MATGPDARLLGMLDREEIFDLVRRERFCRDQRHWEEMRGCFHREAHIRTSWFDGGAEDYVEASRARHGPAGTSKHWVFPGYLTLRGDRATVESPAMIFDRIRFRETEVDFHVFCRFHSRVERRDGVWKLMSFEVLFGRDTMRPVDPRDPLPADRAELAGYRPSYRHLTCIQESRGTRVNPNLYGDDRPGPLQGFHDSERRWLESAA